MDVNVIGFRSFLCYTNEFLLGSVPLQSAVHKFMHLQHGPQSKQHRSNFSVPFSHSLSLSLCVCAARVSSREICIFIVKIFLRNGYLHRKLDSDIACKNIQTHTSQMASQTKKKKKRKKEIMGEVNEWKKENKFVRAKNELECRRMKKK